MAIINSGCVLFISGVTYATVRYLSHEDVTSASASFDTDCDTLKQATENLLGTDFPLSYLEEKGLCYAIEIEDNKQRLLIAAHSERKQTVVTVTTVPDDDNNYLLDTTPLMFLGLLARDTQVTYHSIPAKE